MNIEYKNYLIKQTESGRFDLVKKYQKEKVDKVTRQKTGEVEEAFEDLGYDMRLENCINRIILEELKKKEKTTDLKTFLEEFKTQKDLLLQTVKLD